MPARPLLDRLVTFLVGEEWEPERDDDNGILHLLYRDEGVEFDVYLQALEDEQQTLVLSLAPFAVPEDRLLDAAEFAARVNFGLPIGNFELDFDGGELRYKTSLESAADDITTEHLRSLVGANLAVMSRYLVGFRAVVFGEAQPAAMAAELDA